ncbi:hypothetical protein FOV35_01685 [Borreliella afzelii]|nr:hypothetical protein FOV35_01685 [Borreliella afzelii]
MFKFFKRNILLEKIFIIVVLKIDDNNIVKAFVEEKIDYCLKSLYFLRLDAKIKNFIKKK